MQKEMDALWPGGLGIMTRVRGIAGKEIGNGQRGWGGAFGVSARQQILG